MEDNEIENYTNDILLIIKFITNKILNNNENANIEVNNENNVQLFKYCDKSKYFNEKGTKLLKEEEFKNLINILKLYTSIDNYILPFFEKIDIYLIKIIINGYISYDIDESEKILTTIKTIIPLISNKEYIYFIYNKLSKILRLELIGQKENIQKSFKKFCKIFDIWKLIFNYNEDLKLKEKYISLYGNNNIEINISNISQNYVSTVINIYMIKSLLLRINNNIKSFSLIKIYNNEGQICEININDIEFKENQNISDINLLTFIIIDNKINYIINNDDKNKQEIKNDNIKNMKNISKLELLNDFYGKISSIEVIRKYKKRIVFINKLLPNKNEINIIHNYGKETFANQYKSLPNNLIPNEKENILIKLKNDCNTFYKYYPIDESSLKDLKYFGGFEAFIPIFKILKDFMAYIDNKDIIINYISEIINIIINKVFSNINNFNNFKDIIIPLTVALNEISSILNEEEKAKLFKNEVIYYLYIIILISPVAKTAKIIFKDVMNLDNICNIDINYEKIYSEEKMLKVDSIDWHCFIIFVYIEFNLLIYNDINKVPKELFEYLYKIFNTLNNNSNDALKSIDQIQKTKILIIIQFLIGIINNFYAEKIEIFKDFKKIDDLYEFINGASFIKTYLSNICFLMMKILLELNNLQLIKNTEKDSAYDKFYKLFLTLKNIFAIQNIDNPEQKKEKDDLKNKFKEIFINYEENKNFINLILNNENMEYISQEEKIIDEFIDYERQYRHLMKEQFIFNKLWSNKKLFFDKEYKNKLKYKCINYYTDNFQRPIIYPFLDYKYQYPSFSYFVVDKNFYTNEEIKDNYNFYIESQTLDELIEKYNQNNMNLIKGKYKNNIIIYDVCLIKRTHHIKGKLFLIKNNSKIKKIYFLSYPKSCVDTIPSCNYLENNTQQQEFRQTIQNKHVCYGSFFICPDKDCNIKIKINVEDIRMILRRIYFYRKSAIEIFTSNKSYYFNFYENPLMENYHDKMAESNSINIISLLSNSFSYDLVPIDINNQVIGYSKEFNYETKDIIPMANNQKDNISVNPKNKDKDKDKDKIKEEMPNEENKYIDNLLKRWINEDNHYGYFNNEICTFDVIIILNLLSNRSYNDLYQYPIYPLLFFYDKKDNNYSLVSRTLNAHIGFQTDTSSGQSRKKQFINSYEMTKEEINDGISDIPEAYYFNTHYSNGVYTCNYLLRLFPYSFIAIEIQGDGFDEPNRLFHSIEHCFNSISNLNTDLRELLPEFYFLPEMFININEINFKKKNDEIPINDVEMPEIIPKNENSNNYRCFKFIEYMRNCLEEKHIKIYNWLHLIFGIKQRYNDINKLDQYFRSETYFNFNQESNEILSQYLKNDAIMSSVEFGLIPIQILFNDKEIKNNEPNSSYSIVNKNIIESYLKSNIYKDKKYIIYIKNKLDKDNEYQNKKYIFKKGNKNINIIANNLGKLEIYINDKLINEYYDHNDIIEYIYYNKRLNMLATTSLDGYSFIYSMPNKLLSVIKHPNGGYFSFILLSSNPFPSIIAYDKITNDFYSYSINGLFIKKINISEFVKNLDKINIINLYPLLDTDGGAHKDLLVIQIEKGKNIVLNLPFFEKEIEFS